MGSIVPFCEVGAQSGRGYLNTAQMGAMSRKPLKNRGFLPTAKLNRLQLTAGEKQRIVMNRVSNGELSAILALVFQCCRERQE